MDLYDEPPRVEVVNKGKRCDYCRKPAYAKGLCHSHYDKFHYRKMEKLNRVTVMEVEVI